LHVNRKLLGLFGAFLIMLLPCFALAQGFGVSPSKVKIDNLSPGETGEFELTIRNRDQIAHNFSFTTFQPSQKQRTEKRAPFPDAGWIGFSPVNLSVPANSEANVTVTVAIPPERKWAGQNWEVWLAITSESGELLAVELYVRLLVSTSAAVGTRLNALVVAGVAVGIGLLGYGGYHYFKRKTKSK